MIQRLWRGAVLLGLLLSCVTVSVAQARFDVLVFSGTEGYRHATIPAGIDAIRGLGAKHSFAVTATEDSRVFNSERLGEYEAVIFLNTSGDILDDVQQAALEQYIREGGGFVGIHGAAATEYEWTWYGELVGAFFDDHPVPQQAEVHVLDRAHGSTKALPQRWNRFDEWYNYRTNPRGDVHVLAVLDETSYEGGTMGHDHPITWARAFDGGRTWYTGMGHTEDSYSDPLFLEHISGGIEWAAGAAPGDAAATVTSSFDKVVLTTEVTDPNELGIAKDGRVFIAERSGPIKMWDPTTGETEMVGYIPVRMTIEDGLMGLTLDPNFDVNSWLYVYYAPANGGPQRLSRFTFSDGAIDSDSEKVLLEITSQQQDCCHSAGSLTFGPDGNLFLSTGDNSNPFPLGGSPMDERPGRVTGDAQRTSANTNDLRGKVLRIRPLPDGTYEIPEGNLFEGNALHRPEIYTMGHRNPYRISVDPETGWLYIGDVGIGNAPSEARGPWGWDEFNQAKGPGFFGWPYFVGPNEAYRDFDYATQTPGAFFNPEAPVNESPNNTGARELPPAVPALIWYTYGPSEQFPELGAGGINPMAGPVYRYDGATASSHALPPYYDGSLLIYEWMRNWIQEVKLDEVGKVVEINPFLPGLTFTRPADVEIGTDGRLYVIEWGETFWGSNPDAQVVRVDYRGSRPEGEAPALSEASGSSGEGYPAPGAPDRIPSGPSHRSAVNDPEGGVSVAWPPDGGIFDYGEPIAYELHLTDPTLRYDDVLVRPFIGHDTHAHPFEALHGLEGALVITEHFEHVPDIYYQDEFAVIEAVRSGAVQHRVRLQPRRLEAEHAAESSGAERRTYGEHPAEFDFAATALTAIILEEAGFAAYAPVHFAGIDSLRIRFKPRPGGSFLLTLDGQEGSVLGEFDASDGRPVPAESVAGQRTPLPDAEALARVPEGIRDAYRGWLDVVVLVPESGETHTLYLTARNQPVHIDWIEFVGKGVSASR